MQSAVSVEAWNQDVIAYQTRRANRRRLRPQATPNGSLPSLPPAAANNGTTNTHDGGGVPADRDTAAPAVFVPTAEHGVVLLNHESDVPPQCFLHPYCGWLAPLERSPTAFRGPPLALIPSDTTAGADDDAAQVVPLTVMEVLHSGDLAAFRRHRERFSPPQEVALHVEESEQELYRRVLLRQQRRAAAVGSESGEDESDDNPDSKPHPGGEGALKAVDAENRTRSVSLPFRGGDGGNRYVSPLEGITDARKPIAASGQRDRRGETVGPTEARSSAPKAKQQIPAMVLNGFLNPTKRRKQRERNEARERRARELYGDGCPYQRRPTPRPAATTVPHAFHKDTGALNLDNSGLVTSSGMATMAMTSSSFGVANTTSGLHGGLGPAKKSSADGAGHQPGAASQGSSKSFVTTSVSGGMPYYEEMIRAPSASPRGSTRSLEGLARASALRSPSPTPAPSHHSPK